MCLEQPTKPRIDYGVAIATALDFRGTPTVLVNDRLYGTAQRVVFVVPLGAGTRPLPDDLPDIHAERGSAL